MMLLIIPWMIPAKRALPMRRRKEEEKKKKKVFDDFWGDLHGSDINGCSDDKKPPNEMKGSSNDF